MVAYYPELLKANNERLGSDNFIMPYLNPNHEKKTVQALARALKRYRIPVSLITAKG